MFTKKLIQDGEIEIKVLPFYAQTNASEEEVGKDLTIIETLVTHR